MKLPMLIDWDDTRTQLRFSLRKEKPQTKMPDQEGYVPQSEAIRWKRRFWFALAFCVGISILLLLVLGGHIQW